MKIQSEDEQWKKDRLGKVTGTRSFTVVDVGRDGNPKPAYYRLIDTLALQLLTGEEAPTYTNEYMRHGTLTEPVARVGFCLAHDVDVRTVGFKDHDTIKYAGASLDGVIDAEKASIEIKCPKMKNHLLYLDEKIPPEYMCQIQWGLACYPELTHCYFISFNEEVEASKQLFVKRIERNNKMIRQMEEKVSEFVVRLEERLEQLRETTADI